MEYVSVRIPGTVSLRRKRRESGFSETQQPLEQVRQPSQAFSQPLTHFSFVSAGQIARTRMRATRQSCCSTHNSARWKLEHGTPKRGIEQRTLDAVMRRTDRAHGGYVSRVLRVFVYMG